jgi:hypothetical protein
MFAAAEPSFDMRVAPGVVGVEAQIDIVWEIDSAVAE